MKKISICIGESRSLFDDEKVKSGKPFISLDLRTPEEKMNEYKVSNLNFTYTS